MAYDYGGWYDNPDTGKNQRWFNGIWTDGSEPMSYQSLEQQLLGTYDSATDRYINDLINTTKGDRDFILAQIDREHEKALGSSDEETARFLESVANKFEEQYGRIRTDFEQLRARTQDDLKLLETRTERDTTTVLDRLAEDERVFKEQFAKEAQGARRDLDTALNERGIMNEKRSEAGGLAGREIGDLEGAISDRLLAYDRALGRTRDDVLTSKEDTLYDARLGASRRIEDLTTAARRDTLDTRDSLSDQKLAAQREYEKRQKELERLRQQDKLDNVSRARYDAVATGY